MGSYTYSFIHPSNFFPENLTSRPGAAYPGETAELPGTVLMSSRYDVPKTWLPTCTRIRKSGYLKVSNAKKDPKKY